MTTYLDIFIKEASSITAGKSSVAKITKKAPTYAQPVPPTQPTLPTLTATQKQTPPPKVANLKKEAFLTAIANKADQLARRFSRLHHPPQGPRYRDIGDIYEHLGTTVFDKTAIGRRRGRRIIENDKWSLPSESFRQLGRETAIAVPLAVGATTGLGVGLKKLHDKQQSPQGKAAVIGATGGALGGAILSKKLGIVPAKKILPLMAATSAVGGATGYGITPHILGRKKSK